MELPEELPKISQKAPYKVELEAGKMYGWCSCGLSAEEPWCDGAHKQFPESGFKSVKFTAIKNGTYYMCGCKHAKDGRPFCDGTHKEL